MPRTIDVVFVVVQSWTAPVGKLLITWSYTASGKRKRLYWYGGMFLSTMIVPIGLVAAYSLCPRAFIGPIYSTEALVNCFLAWLFLDEGRHMNIETVRGVVLYAIGLAMLTVAYGRHLDSTVVDIVDWGRFVFFTGAALAAASVATWLAVAQHSMGGRSPWWWIVVAGLYGSFDYVVGADTWLVGGSPGEWETRDAKTWTEGVVLGIFVAVVGLLSLGVVAALLGTYPLHVVAPAVQALKLVVNVLADGFVYGRWSVWGALDYVLAILGVGLMALGIRRLTPA